MIRFQTRLFLIDERQQRSKSRCFSLVVITCGSINTVTCHDLDKCYVRKINLWLKISELKYGKNIEVLGDMSREAVTSYIYFK